MQRWLATDLYWLMVAMTTLVLSVLGAVAAYRLAQSMFKRFDKTYVSRIVSRLGSGSSAGHRLRPKEYSISSLLSGDLLVAVTLLGAPERLRNRSGLLSRWWFAAGRVLVGVQNYVHVEQTIAHSGLLGRITRESVEAVSALASLVWVIIAALLLAFLQADAAPAAVLVIATVPVVARLPYTHLRRVARNRKCSLQLEVIPWLDMLSMAAAAGLSFDRAAEEYTVRFQGEFADLLGSARIRWQSGMATRESALLEVADAVGSSAYSRVTSALVQAVAQGTPLATAAESYAMDMRDSRRNELEAQIGKAPVKMLLPLGGLILPAMLIILFTPVLSQVFVGLGGGW